jgi:hypothetical protein
MSFSKFQNIIGVIDSDDDDEELHCHNHAGHDDENFDDNGEPSRDADDDDPDRANEEIVPEKLVPVPGERNGSTVYHFNGNAHYKVGTANPPQPGAQPKFSNRYRCKKYKKYHCQAYLIEKISDGSVTEYGEHNHLQDCGDVNQANLEAAVKAASLIHLSESMSALYKRFKRHMG